VKIDTTLATVLVVVMDRDGRSVPKLERVDFKLFENGVEQTLDYFTPVDVPFQVGLMLDTSGSTFLSLPEIKSRLLFLLGPIA
jgi:hypothetical protein